MEPARAGCRQMAARPGGGVVAAELISRRATINQSVHFVNKQLSNRNAIRGRKCAAVIVTHRILISISIGRCSRFSIALSLSLSLSRCIQTSLSLSQIGSRRAGRFVKPSTSRQSASMSLALLRTGTAFSGTVRWTRRSREMHLPESECGQRDELAEGSDQQLPQAVHAADTNVAFTLDQSIGADKPLAQSADVLASDRRQVASCAQICGANICMPLDIEGPARRCATRVLAKKHNRPESGPKLLT